MKMTRLGLTASIMVGLIGCANSGPGSEMVSSDMDTKEIVAAKDQEISSQRKQIETLQRQVEQQKASAATTSMGATTASTGTTSQLFPPDPKPGQCYARVLIPGEYKTAQETVLLKEESERFEIVPAQYKTVEERVLVREASTRLEVIPAQYEKVTERVMVREATTRLEEQPATYKTISEQVLLTPARTEWKRGPAASFAAAGNVINTKSTDTGEIMCLVEVPATYKTVTRTVLQSPATTKEIAIPAEYKTVTRTALKTPATTREITIPAEYDTVKVTKLVAPASRRSVKIPAEYQTVTQNIKVSEDAMEWRQVVCEVNLNPDNVRKLQTALKRSGQYQGTVDGVLGPMTLKAANSYARSKGLPTGSNYIAVEVASSLGLKM